MDKIDKVITKLVMEKASCKGSMKLFEKSLEEAKDEKTIRIIKAIINHNNNLIEFFEELITDLEKKD